MMITTPTELLPARSSPATHDWAGPWCCAATFPLDRFLALSFRLSAPPRQRLPYTVTSGVAVLELAGVLMKYGEGFSGTVSARRQVRNALGDSRAKAIVLRIDSPGGQMAGIYDLVDELLEANRKKPVLAFIEDTGASAAYA